MRVRRKRIPTRRSFSTSAASGAHRGSILKTKLRHGFFEDLAPSREHFFGALGSRSVGDLRKRHVLDVTPVEDRAAHEVEVFEGEVETRQDLWNSLHLEVDDRNLDATLGELGARGLEHQDLGDVDGREATAYDQCVIGVLVTPPVVAGFVFVIEGDDEGVLVDEALVDIGGRPPRWEAAGRSRRRWPGPRH